jgi:cytochrome c-type protein NapC
MKVFQKVRGWGAGPGSILVLIAGLVVGAFAFASMGSFMVYANSEQFCATACHEMGELQKEHKGTIHDMNRSGVRATCPDCHVPHEYIPNYWTRRRSSRPSATNWPSASGRT